MSETLSGYSVYTLIGDGVTTNFPIQFSLGTLRDDSVKVSVEGEVDGEGNQVYRTWERVIGDPGVMRVNGSPPGNGKVITFARKIVRDTLLHQYANGSVLNYPSLDESHLQLLMLCQELFDGLGLENVQTNINMTGHTITGLAVDESNPTSAATVGWTKEARDRAEQAAQQAEQSADASRASSVTAAGFAANAATSADNSASSADLARRWASEDEDVPVLDEKYSAYHHAQKAAGEAADAAHDAQRAEDAADRAEATGGPATMDNMGIVHPDGSASGLTITTPGKLKVTPATDAQIGGVRIGTLSDVEDPSSITNGPAVLAVGSEALDALLPTFLIGSIISTYAAAGYVPNGCVLPDGAEYTQSQFPSFYTGYLAAGKIVTCTYAEFASQVAVTGNCGKFALDTVNKKFKVPLLKDGDSITQATSAAELGRSVKAGLPNIQGNVYVAGLTYGDGVLAAGALSAHDSNRGNGVASVVAANGCATITLNAANSSPIYRNGVTTVIDEQVRLRHFVVLASAQNNASMFDWSNYMAALAGKANVDFDNIPLTGKANAGKAMAYALDYDNPVSFPILDDWLYPPVGGLLTGWIWMDPAGPKDAGAVTVGNSRVAAVEKGKSVSTISCFLDPGVRVKKDYGVYNIDTVIVPWKVV